MRQAVRFLLPLLAASTLAAAAAPPVVQAAGPAAAAADAPAEIRGVLARYAQAWYEGNAALMAEVLQPEYVQLSIRHVAHASDATDASSALSWLDRVDRGEGRNPPERKTAVSDLVVHGELATARLELAGRTEQLELVRWNQRWRVLHSTSMAQPEAAP